MTEEEPTEDQEKKKRSRWRLRLDNVKAEWPVSGGLTLSGTGLVGLVVVGLAWWFLHQTPSQIEVPNLTGTSYTTAEALLRDEGLGPGRAYEERSDQPVGTVLRSDPPAGMKVNKGAGVNLVIASSRGSPNGSNAMPPPADVNPGPAVNPAPQVPDVPQVPEVPQTPQVPKIPEVPQAPQVSDMPALAATRTNLTTSPTSPTPTNTPVYLTAMVNPRTATGTVQFKDGTTNLGNPITLTNGTASRTVASLTTGLHHLTATFTPTNPTTYASSTARPVTYMITTTPTQTTTTTSPTPPAQSTYPPPPQSQMPLPSQDLPR
ncbi:MAG: Ig-like domain repeat protein [Pseudonocardiaceae bacterium]